MANLKNFIFNSDYSTDKIAFTKKDAYTIIGPAGSFRPQLVYINTHIKTQLYAEGDYTIEGQNTVRPMGNWGHDGITVQGFSFMYNGECWLGIAVYATQSSAVGKVINYRLWAYYGDKDAKNADIPATTSTNQSRLALNTDNNYPRFILDGEIANGQKYTHSLGYIPYIKTWQKYTNVEIDAPDGSGTTITVDSYGQNAAMYLGDASSDPFRAMITQVSDTEVITYLTNDPNDSQYVYFRLYAL